jgi:hypothetical protein
VSFVMAEQAHDMRRIASALGLSSALRGTSLAARAMGPKIRRTVVTISTMSVALGLRLTFASRSVLCDTPKPAVATLRAGRAARGIAFRVRTADPHLSESRANTSWRASVRLQQ